MENKKLMMKMKISRLSILVALLACGCSAREADMSLQQHAEMEETEVSGLAEEPEHADVVDNQALSSNQATEADVAIEVWGEPKLITLGFAGDVNLDENWPTTLHLNQQDNGIEDCISEEIIEDLRACDLFMLNNEFTYSDRGTPMNGKMYTFRATPSRVDVIKELGADIVLLANNHIYDYGAEAMLDTMDVLKESGIDYVGAAKNDDEACNIVYYEIDGMKIAYVAASRAEKNKMTPQATEDSPGILRAYDPKEFLSLVQEADQNSDFVVANIHWGTEYSFELEEVQKELGHALAEAGADLVIGTHPHVLQGIEIYDDVPIFYSLGNFWFNEKDLYSGYAKVTVDASDASIQEIQFVPCVQQNCETRLPMNNEERQEILDFLEDISEHVMISEEGMIKTNFSY